MFSLKRKRSRDHNLTTVDPTRDDYLKNNNNLLFESRLESFIKKTIERQAALAIQNAMDISDVVSPITGIDTDVLKMQIAYGASDPHTYVDNLLDLLKGRFAGNVIKNNIIIRNMKANQTKSLEIIRKSLLEDTVNGDFIYDIFKLCVNNTNRMNKDVHYYYYQQQYTSTINTDEAIVSAPSADSARNESKTTGDDEDENTGEGEDEGEGEGEGDAPSDKGDIVQQVVDKLKTVLRGSNDIPNDSTDENYLYNHVKNVLNKAGDLLLLGDDLSQHQRQSSMTGEELFLLSTTPDPDTSMRAIKEILIQVEDMINLNFSKGESQLNTLEEIAVLRSFFDKILHLKTNVLVSQYRLFLSFIVMYSLLYDLEHNTRIYLKKKRGCEYRLLFDTIDTNEDKFLLSKLNTKDSIFILSLMVLFLGPCVESFLCPGNPYITAIRFINDIDSVWRGRSSHVNISMKIKRIVDQLTARETFLKERKDCKSINTINAYISQNSESDALLNPLHCILSDIGNVVDTIADGFRDLFMRTTSALLTINCMLRDSKNK